MGIFVNDIGLWGESVLETPLQEGDEIMLLPVIAGGTPKESVIPDERRKAELLDDSEIERYNKHLMLREIGVKGQKRLKAARVLVIGLGALGSSVIQTLSAAGVGTIGIADSTEVSPDGLQSQVIYRTRDVHRPRVAAVRDVIRAMNPKVKIETISQGITPGSVSALVGDYDIVVDCTDNYFFRYLINDACALAGKPVVFGAIYQTEGQVSVFDAKTGPCFRCRFPSPPPPGLVPSCAESGVMSPLPGIIGSMQANETLKLIVGGGESLEGKIAVVDAWNNRGKIVRIGKRESCPVCGKAPSVTSVEEVDYEEFCGLKPSKEELPVEGIEAEELAQRLERGDPMTIVDVREYHERAIHRFPNAIVIPIGQLARRQKELDPEIDTIFICREGKRSILAINTLREAGYKGPMYNLKGGVESAKDIIFSNEGAWL